MEKKDINTRHHVHSSGNYAIISYKNQAFFYNISKKSSTFLSGYIPSKNDSMAISDDGKIIFIMKKNEIKKRIYRLEKIETEAQIYSADSGKIISNFMIPVYDDAIFGLKNLKKITPTFHYNNQFILIKALNDSDTKKIAFSCKQNIHFTPLTILGSGQDYYVTSFNENPLSPLQICSYNNQRAPIPIIYGKFFSSNDAIEIFDTEQIDNTLTFKRKNIHKNICHRRMPPSSITFTPHDEYIVIKYRSTTDIIALDKKNHTIKGIVLPFAGDVIIKNGKAVVVDEEDETNSYFLYQDGYFTDSNTYEIDESYGEIFMTDTRKDPDGKKIKSHVFTLKYDKDNNPFLVAKKILSVQEKLFMHTHKNLTDVDFKFLSEKNTKE